MSDGTSWRTSMKSKFAKASIATLAVLAAGGIAVGASDAHEAAATWSFTGDPVIVVEQSAEDAPTNESPRGNRPGTSGPLDPNFPDTPHSFATWS